MLISLDIFDTSIFRKVYKPADLFKLIGGDKFYSDRIIAQKRATLKYRNPTIYQIYEFFPGHNVQKEIDFELKYCFANQKILDLYNNSNDEFIFISDMYLPSDILKTMLEKCGYKNPTVFVSCEYNSRKSERLFKIVEDKLKRKIDKHYGDNYKVDIIGAKRNNIEGIYIPKLQDSELHTPDISNSILKRLLASYEFNGANATERTSYLMTVILTMFTKWIIANRKEGSKIFFLSRDMYIPYIIARDYLKQKDVYYLHVSRKSLMAVMLRNPSKVFKNKANFIYSEEEQQKILESNQYDEAEKYLSQFDMKDNDIIVDIGYSGSAQRAIELLLNIKLRGFYIQASCQSFAGMETHYLTRYHCMESVAITEQIISSDENEIVGYKDGKVVYRKDSDIKKKWSKKFQKLILSKVDELLPYNISQGDCETILSNLLYDYDDELLSFYNSKCFIDRKYNLSIINFDEEKINDSNFREYYNESYCRRLFKVMLSRSKKLSHLAKYLK